MDTPEEGKDLPAFGDDITFELHIFNGLSKSEGQYACCSKCFLNHLIIRYVVYITIKANQQLFDLENYHPPTKKKEEEGTRVRKIDELRRVHTDPTSERHPPSIIPR